MDTRNDRATWIKGGTAQCRVPPKLRLQPQRLVLLGAPGVGKGTQAELLCAGLSICHLATADLLRATTRLTDGEQTPTTCEALTGMEQVTAIPEHTMLNLIQERKVCLSCQGGFLLDGFPRTLSQAKALDDLLTQEQIRINAVLHYTLPFEVLIHRLSGRRTCRKCQAVFHITRPPRVAEICDHCGGGLAQREDDFPEAVEARILAYERSAKPLIDYYVGHGTLRTISADGSPERIYARTLAILDA